MIYLRTWNSLNNYWKLRLFDHYSLSKVQGSVTQKFMFIYVAGLVRLTSTWRRMPLHVSRLTRKKTLWFMEGWREADIVIARRRTLAIWGDAFRQWIWVMHAHILDWLEYQLEDWLWFYFQLNGFWNLSWLANRKNWGY